MNDFLEWWTAEDHKESSSNSQIPHAGPICNRLYISSCLAITGAMQGRSQNKL